MKLTDTYYDFRKSARDTLKFTYGLHELNLSNVNDVKLTNDPISFYRECCMYFDKSSLPQCCKNVSDLTKLLVLYGIFCIDSFYIGQTTDFGERMSTHIKDAKKYKEYQRLYPNMVKAGECISFVFGVFDDIDTMEKAEHTIIRECKDYSIKKACNFNDAKYKFIKESKDDMREYALKHCYNIKD